MSMNHQFEVIRPNPNIYMSSLTPNAKKKKSLPVLPNDSNP